MFKTFLRDVVGPQLESARLALSTGDYQAAIAFAMRIAEAEDAAKAIDAAKAFAAGDNRKAAEDILGIVADVVSTIGKFEKPLTVSAVAGQGCESLDAKLAHVVSCCKAIPITTSAGPEDTSMTPERRAFLLQVLTTVLSALLRQFIGL